LSEAIIQGSLPRPAELEVYLGDSGIFCRPINKDENGEEVTVGATSEAPGTPLYIF
jgi:ATP-dependent Clp protease ATP-binding subunit ClpC